MERKINIKNLLVLILFLFISIGFAYLSSNLSINGGALVKKVDWNIYFSNIKNIRGSEFIVTAPTTSKNTTKNLNFKVALEDPGDSYSFNVDVVNDGNVDAMVSLINNTYDTLTDIQKKLFTINITYSDGASIEPKNFLGAGSLDTFTITVTYSKDIEIADLPSEDIELTVDINLEYIQATEVDSKRNDKIKSIIVKDLSENGNDGKMYGGIVRNSDGTMTLDGINDYIDCGLENYDFENNISYIIRLRPLSLKSGYNALFGNWESGGSGIMVVGNKIFFDTYINDKYKVFYSNKVAEINQWYTIIATYDNSNLKLYVNQERVGLHIPTESDLYYPSDVEEVTDAATGNIKVSNYPIMIGVNPGEFTNDFSSFVVDYALLFNRAVSENEILNYSDTISSINKDGLMFYYDFN